MSTPTDSVRVGTADRDRVAQLIGEAAGAGYLSLDESDERLAAAYAARTAADLGPLLADLPRDWLAARDYPPGRRGVPADRARQFGPARPFGWAWPVPAGLLLLAVAVVAGIGFAATAGFFVPWPLFWIAAFWFWFWRGGRRWRR